MRKIISLLVPVFFGHFLMAQEYFSFQSYVQIRLTTDFDSLYNGEIRRLKFYLREGKDFYPHWSYFISAGIYQRSNERLIIHDIRLSYKIKNILIHIGQFIPTFSLQRSQSDWKMAVPERSQAVRYLQADGTTGIRDIGAQMEISFLEKSLKFRAGLFNGRGTKQWSVHKPGVLATANIQYSLFKKNDRQLILGTSLMYRKARDLPLPGLLPDSSSFSGIDRRWDSYFLIKNKSLSLQAEYIRANLNNLTIQGYYVQATASINKVQAVIYAENFINTDYSCLNCKKIFIGCNYLADKNYFCVSNFITFDVNNFSPGNMQYIIQVQIFLIK